MMCELDFLRCGAGCWLRTHHRRTDVLVLLVARELALLADARAPAPIAGIQALAEAAVVAQAEAEPEAEPTAAYPHVHPDHRDEEDEHEVVIQDNWRRVCARDARAFMAMDDENVIVVLNFNDEILDYEVTGGAEGYDDEDFVDCGAGHARPNLSLYCPYRLSPKCISFPPDTYTLYFLFLA